MTACLRSAVVLALAGAVSVGFVLADSPDKAASPAQLINEQLAKSWAANGLKPSAKASHFEFARRVYLDLIGRIPRPEEVKEFVAKGGNRPELIRKLLYDKAYADEYARNQANLWSVWLLTRSANPTYRDQMHLWLEEQFAENVSYKSLVTQLITAQGKTNENGAVNFVLAHLGDPIPNKRIEAEGHFDVVPLTSRTTRLFLGLQTQCVQCHDHKFNPEWKQQSFWGVNVFFRQVDREGTPINRQPRNTNQASILTLRDDPKVNADGLVNYERRNAMVLPTPMVFVDGRRANGETGRTRREILAELITSHEDFPKAMVNRTWGHLFGRGLHEQPAVDDFGEHNKVLHPQLLDGLAKEFVQSGCDIKQLLTCVCNSDVYQLTSQPNATNDKPETDVQFSRMLLKAMTPEQLLESLWVATLGKNGDAKSAEERRKAWTASLVKNFGDDEGNEITFNGTVIQALLMMNGKEINAEILNPTGTVAQSIGKHKTDFGKILADVYMAALGRMPTDKEVAIARRVADKSQGRADATFYADVMWALLNSNEFILNH